MVVMAGCRSTNTAITGDTAGAVSAAEAPLQAPEIIRHAALGAGITATSTHEEQPAAGPAANLVDGRLDTRWSSAYAEPQSITIDIGKTIAVDQLHLHWEAAFATRYTVSVSTDNRHWAKAQACLKTKSETQAGIDRIPLNGLEARYIRLDLQKRLNPELGFSLWEIEVVAK